MSSSHSGYGEKANDINLASDSSFIKGFGWFVCFKLRKKFLQQLPPTVCTCKMLVM